MLQPGELGRPAAPREQTLSVAVHHGGGLPSPGLEDRRQLDARGNHVLRRADPSAVPGQALHHRRRQAGLARHRLEDPWDLARVEPLTNPPALADRAEQRPSEIVPRSSHARTSLTVSRAM